MAAMDQRSRNQRSRNQTDMPIGEIFVMAGAFTVIFAILFCGMKPDRERRRPRIRNKCNNNKCKYKFNQKS